MKFAIAVIVKDEADSLLEWIAYHRVLGADHILVADNGSTDGTRELLANLDKYPWMTVLDVVTPPDKAPQLVAYSRLAEACPVNIDVVAFIDADEFIFPQLSDKAETSLLSLSEAMNQWLNSIFFRDDVSGVVINWSCFGSSGQLFKEPGLVIERFQQRANNSYNINHHYKSIVRRSRLERFENPHSPLLDTGKLVNALGHEFEYWCSGPNKQKVHHGLSENIVWEGAILHHYVVKSLEEFVVKKSRRGSAATVGKVKHAQYFRSHDRNDEHCANMVPFIPEVKEQIRYIEQGISLSEKLKSFSDPSRSTQLFSRAKRAFSLTSPGQRTPVSRFAVDYPSQSSDIKFQKSQVLLQGWVLLAPEFTEFQDSMKLAVSWSDDFEYLVDINIDRPDVISYYHLEETPSENGVSDDGPAVLEEIALSSKCGFRTLLPNDIRQFTLSVDIAGLRFPLSKVAVEYPEDRSRDAYTVVTAEDGNQFWESNHGQWLRPFQGLSCLTQPGLDSWERFFQTLQQLREQRKWQGVVALVPDKAAVLCNEGGMAISDRDSVLDQIVHLSADAISLSSPLRLLGKEAYSPELQAFNNKAAHGVLRHLLSEASIRVSDTEIVSFDSLDVSAEARNLDSYRVYDNGVNLSVFHNAGATVDKRVFLIGEDSAISLLPFLVFSYKTVVFLFGTARLDLDLMANVESDLTLCLIENKNLLRPPRFSKLTEEAIQSAKGGTNTINNKKVIPESLLHVEGYDWSMPFSEQMRVVLSTLNHSLEYK